VISRNASPRAALAAVAILATLTSSCGQARTVENYCDTFWAEGGKIRDSAKEAQRNGGMLGSLGVLFSAPSDMANFFDKLDAVAPDEIEPDIAKLRDGYQKIGEKMGDGLSADPMSMFGSLAGNMAIGFGLAGSERRVDAFTAKHCGAPPKSG
jgi:hypothetical protein